MQQASQQAQASCEESAISGMARLSLVVDIESRLHELLTGDESVPEAQVIVQWVLEVHSRKRMRGSPLHEPSKHRNGGIMWRACW